MEYVYGVDLTLGDINTLITTANIRIRELQENMQNPRATTSDKEFYREWIKELRVVIDKLEHPYFHEKES